MNTSVVSFTHHSRNRICVRCSVKSNKAYALADRAWRNGKTIDDYTGKIRRKLEDIAHRHYDEGISLRMHSNNCYIFTSDAVLITVYSLAGYMASVNRPKYSRFRDDDDDIVPDSFFDIFEMLMHLFFFRHEMSLITKSLPCIFFTQKK